MSESSISIGIAGCGRWGAKLARNFSSLRDASVAAICDPCEESLLRMEESHSGVRCYRDFAQLIRDPEVEAVAIATPAGNHFDSARSALCHGKHVLVEKPMALSSVDCQKLVELADERGLTLMVDHTYLYSAPIRRIKEMIGAGELGSILYVGSQRLGLADHQEDINVTWDLAPHDLSILLFMLGELPISVNCRGVIGNMETMERVTNLSLVFGSGVFASIQSSWLEPKKVRRMTIVGSLKIVVFDDLQPMEKLEVYERSESLPPSREKFGEFSESYHYGDVVIPRIEHREPLAGVCGSFVESVRTGIAPESDGRLGRDVVRILEASSASLGSKGSEVLVAN